jgi:hypothetical protein
MGLCMSTTARPQSTGRIGQGALGGETGETEQQMYVHPPVMRIGLWVNMAHGQLE